MWNYNFIIFHKLPANSEKDAAVCYHDYFSQYPRVRSYRPAHRFNCFFVHKRSDSLLSGSCVFFLFGRVGKQKSLENITFEFPAKHQWTQVFVFFIYICYPVITYQTRIINLHFEQFLIK